MAGVRSLWSLTHNHLTPRVNSLERARELSMKISAMLVGMTQSSQASITVRTVPIVSVHQLRRFLDGGTQAELQTAPACSSVHQHCTNRSTVRPHV